MRTAVNRSLARGRPSRKFGDFSANGEQYSRVSALLDRLKIDEMESKVVMRRAAVKRPRSADTLVLSSGLAGWQRQRTAGNGNEAELGTKDLFRKVAGAAVESLRAKKGAEVSAEGSLEAGVIQHEKGEGSPSAKGRLAFPGLSRQDENTETTQKSSLLGRAGLWDEGSMVWDSPKSTAECVRDADGSDVCHYGEVVCYDGERGKLVLVDDDRKGEAFASEIIFQDGRWTQGRLPPDSKWPLPINNKIEGVWESADVLANATFLDGGLWFVRPETDTTNHIWHNGLSFTGLLQAQMRNASGAFPPLDHVLVLNRTAGTSGYTDYNLGMLKIVSQPQTKLVFTKDLPHKNRLLCAERGGITSYKPSWSTGPLDAAELRARAYEHLKIPHVDRANWTRVTLVNRPSGFPRHVENADEVTEALRKLGLEVDLVQEVARQSRSFREQVLTMSQTGILIAPHGGGLANLAWLPENAAVIELFPNKCVQTEYRNMAAVRNLIYFGVEAVNYTHPQVGADFTPEEVARCQGLHSIDHSHDGTCNQMVKNYPFRVPVEELAKTVRYALEHFFMLQVPFPNQRRL
ncbi:hypothetical protein KFL_001530060 [Klebsormidium nitens]|uniref:Glycosyltransferase 61 catalytic domain-containing protein n=1 Tax=Klebsormidium nitens TaxID=105231 RepID=A0A1Y1HZE8_KLENI|nr:hypothetical protein KFL_001530060 [Klebsormidium nitens]|eukprot:GAQ83563.1 hypothetical protein KFL_001530060 [Klebsormidium nitens]